MNGGQLGTPKKLWTVIVFLSFVLYSQSCFSVSSLLRLGATPEERAERTTAMAACYGPLYGTFLLYYSISVLADGYGADDPLTYIAMVFGVIFWCCACFAWADLCPAIKCPTRRARGLEPPGHYSMGSLANPLLQDPEQGEGAGAEQP